MPLLRMLLVVLLVFIYLVHTHRCCECNLFLDTLSLVIFPFSLRFSDPLDYVLSHQNGSVSGNCFLCNSPRRRRELRFRYILVCRFPDSMLVRTGYKIAVYEGSPFVHFASTRSTPCRTAVVRRFFFVFFPGGGGRGGRNYFAI